MNYVESLNLFGVPAKEIPCIPGSGAPSTSTEGAVGCLYMDTDTSNIYKCVAANDGVYAWEKIDTENFIRYVDYKTFLVENNILMDDICICGEGWTGNLTDGFTHVSGYTEPLTFNIDAVDGEVFFIEGGCPNTGATIIKLAIGESYLSDPYNGTNQISWCVKSIAGGSLAIIPESSFSGTLTNLSCKKISKVGAEEVSIQLQDIMHSPNDDHFSGMWNVQVGPNALENIVNGTRNIAIGKSALNELITGGRNIAIGTYTLPVAKTAEDNINIGADSGLLVSNANACIAIGKTSMGRNLAMLTNNIAIGHAALYGDGTTHTMVSSGNIAIGTHAGYKNAAKSNVFIGSDAGYNNNSNMNTFIGGSAAIENTGWGNVAIGCQSSISGSGTKSIAIGFKANATKSYQAVIGNSDITETLLNGNLVIRGTDDTKRQIVFNEDGSCSWITAT